MRLERLELEAVRTPLARPFRTAGGTLTEREGFLVFARAQGVTGVGEALPLPSAGTETLAQCAEALQQAKALIGRELGAVPELPHAPAARFGIETAMLDLLGRIERRPLLGAQGTIAVNAVIDASEDAAAQARALHAEGFRCFKLKSARDVVAVRDAIGQDAELRLDANGAWSLEQASRELTGLDIAYCEDPLATPDEVPALRGATRVRIAADVWLATKAGRDRVLREGLADVCILKPAVLGGVARALEFALEARARGVQCVVTTTLDGVVARMAALHLAAALDNGLAHGLATGRWLERDWAEDPAPVVRGRMTVPAGPGLGVELARASREVAA
jgi:o-succinylbenzoate synthase